MRHLPRSEELECAEVVVSGFDLETFTCMEEYGLYDSVCCGVWSGCAAAHAQLQAVVQRCGVRREMDIYNGCTT